MGGDAKARQVSIELDTPRTIITVPWNWVEEEPEPSTAAESATASPDAQYPPSLPCARRRRQNARRARQASVRRGR